MLLSTAWLVTKPLSLVIVCAARPVFAHGVAITVTIAASMESADTSIANVSLPYIGGFTLLWRVVQGLGGGGLVPVAQAILVDTFPLARRAAAFTISFIPQEFQYNPMGSVHGGVISTCLTQHRVARFIRDFQQQRGTRCSS